MAVEYGGSPLPPAFFSKGNLMLAEIAVMIVFFLAEESNTAERLFVLYGSLALRRISSQK